jgi:hypothetical protein
MLFRAKNPGKWLRGRWVGQCQDRPRRGICGVSNDTAIAVSLCSSYQSTHILLGWGDTYPEARRIWNPNWQIRKHRQRAIQICLPERKIMANLMDCKEQILVCRCADDVCNAPEAERPERGVL